MRAGIKRRGGEASAYIADTCLLADRMKERPSTVARWSPRDRALMLAYYQVKAEIEKKANK